MGKVAKNFFYQSIFQLARILLPIITVPIVSKALGPEGLGSYNFTNSIVQYFVLFAGLGITTYGNREIAIIWNSDRSKTSIIFCELVLCKVLLGIINLALYLVLICFMQNRSLLLLQSLVLVATILDISWFFMGIEDFKKTSMLNLLFQIIGFVCILVFVNEPDDVLVYTLIQVLTVLFSQLCIWLFLKRYITIEKIQLSEAVKHIKKSLEYFIPQIAITLYTNLNKTILGIFIGSYAVGYYTNSLQLNTVFITLITTLDFVLLPHMSGLFAKNGQKSIVSMMDKTIDGQLFFSIPIMFGILTVYDKLIPWFFGDKFIFISKVVPIFSVLVVIVPLGMSISRQYLMPIGKMKDYNKSVILGALINIFGNLLSVPLMGFWGVVISYILSECFVTFVRTRSFLKTTNFCFNYSAICIYFGSALVMCVTTRLITADMNPNVMTNIIQVVLAIMIYMFVTRILHVCQRHL